MIKNTNHIFLKSETAARDFVYNHYRRQRRIEQHFVPKIATALKKQITDFVDAGNKHGFKYALDHIFSIVGYGEIAEIIKSLYHKSAYIESNYVLKNIRRSKKSINLKRLGNPKQALGLTFEDLSPVIEGYFKIRLLNDSAIPITDYTKDLITRFFAKQVESGVSFENAVGQFKETAIVWTGREGIADARARLIATTESTRSMSFGGMIGGYMSQVDCDKIWVTSHDERVRGARTPARFPHTVLDLNRSSLFGVFNNGEEIKFPGDPEADIRNIANCRCAMYFEEKSKPLPNIERFLTNFLTDFFNAYIVGNILSNITEGDDKDKN